jgi:predicted enzyme related to lactoylglutathione lyase
MGQAVVHVEVIGAEPAKLRSFYGDLFGWEFDTSGKVSESISEPTDYGFTDNKTEDGVGVPGGVGGGAGKDPYVTFYVNVPDVEAALRRAEELGGTRLFGPDKQDSGLVIGHFTDPEGHRIGLAQL